MKRLLDFARDFGKERKFVNTATAIKGEWGRLNEESTTGATSLAIIEVVTAALNLIDGIMDNLSLEVVR